MHNLQKIRIFRILLYITYPLSLIVVFPLALFKKKYNDNQLFFFFDRYAIGGAQRIHLDILNSIPKTFKQLFFTRLSKDKNLKEAFYSVPNTKTEDIHFWCDYLLFRLFSVHYYSFYINRHKKAHVFSSNSTFFYDMLPFIRKDIIKTELLHNFTHGKNGMEFFGLANVPYLNYRITYDNFTYNNILNQYKEYNVDTQMKERMLFIEPGVDIPPFEYKNYDPPLRVLYAGRGGPQKRIYLLNKIAEYFIEKQKPVEFHFAGTMMDELSELVRSHSVIHGEISRSEDMHQLYKQCHAILMTSAYEGFPMLIKEGMANGCIPIVTALEGNKTHLKNGENSLLMMHPEDEASVVSEGIAHIEYLLTDTQIVADFCTKAYVYAQHFDKNAFQAKYKTFFLG